MYRFQRANGHPTNTSRLSQYNILINNEIPPQACISDFGLSSIVSRMSFNPTTLTDTGGTPGYMAPELYLAGAKPTKEADIYSFGMLVYEVITGSHPFREQRPMELPMLTTSGVRPIRPEDPATIGFGQGTWELIENCWDASPQRRPSATEALVHFESVAATSTIVDPGPSLWARRVDDAEFIRPDGNSIGFCECHRRYKSDSRSSPRPQLPQPNYLFNHLSTAGAGFSRQPLSHIRLSILGASDPPSLSPPLLKTNQTYGTACVTGSWPLNYFPRLHGAIPEASPTFVYFLPDIPTTCMRMFVEYPHLN